MDMKAFDIYKYASQGYCCSQIFLLLALEEEGRKNYDLIRAANGMCVGMQCRGTCGVLSGAIMTLGLYAGKGMVQDERSQYLKVMAEEITEWFKNEYKSIQCDDLVKVDIFTDQGEVYPVKCGEMILQVYDKVRDILSDYDYELGARENGEEF